MFDFWIFFDQFLGSSDFLIRLTKLLALTVLMWLFISLVKGLVLNRLKHWSQRTDSTFDDLLLAVISRWDKRILALVAFSLANQIVVLSSGLSKIVMNAAWLGVAIYLGLNFHQLVDYFFLKYQMNKLNGDGDFDPTLPHLLKQIVKLFFWLILGVMVLQNLGVEVTALIGGLGIGGLAIAFAVQNILADIFSSISIYFDKPFGVGDYIKLGQDSGVVKKIGIKSTRLQTLRGEELIISNRELTQARVQNFKKLKKRTITFKFSLEYETPHQKLVKIPDLVAEVFRGLEKTELVRVHLVELGASSLDYELVYKFDSKDFQAYRDVHQQVLLRLLKVLGQEKISLAYPVQRMVK